MRFPPLCLFHLETEESSSIRKKICQQRLLSWRIKVFDVLAVISRCVTGMRVSNTSRDCYSECQILQLVNLVSEWFTWHGNLLVYRWFLCLISETNRMSVCANVWPPVGYWELLVGTDHSPEMLCNRRSWCLPICFHILLPWKYVSK